MPGPQAVDSTIDRTTPLPALSSRIVSTAGTLTKTWAPWIKFLFQTVRDNHVRVGNAEASITTEQTVRASADSALASQITTLSATVSSNTAAISTESTARANADSALSSQITTVSAAVSDNAVAITTEASARAAADGTLGAQWGVKINANGRIIGAQTLSASNSTSTFAVLADHFTIIHPTADGVGIQAFTTGLVGGTATVGINGNLLVDGTILARSLAVSQLSAITADVGTVTAGVVQSADGKFVIDLNNKTLTITT